MHLPYLLVRNSFNCTLFIFLLLVFCTKSLPLILLSISACYCYCHFSHCCCNSNDAPAYPWTPLFLIFSFPGICVVLLLILIVLYFLQVFLMDYYLKFPFLSCYAIVIIPNHFRLVMLVVLVVGLWIWFVGGVTVSPSRFGAGI